ncbi:hypothetical protein ABTJ08_19995, partial [Acinetobacter baumannii]
KGTPKPEASSELVHAIELPGHRSDIRDLALSNDDSMLLTTTSRIFFFFFFPLCGNDGGKWGEFQMMINTFSC